ncbi:MAG: hypothetical protein ACRENE_14530 [Polyangiaceae bacterium]
MLYRKAPASPTRMLLSVSVAAAGLLAGACSSNGSAGVGLVDAQADDGQGDDASPGPCGGVCGVVIQDGGFCCGVADASGDVVGFVGGGLFADAGILDTGTGGPCGGVCGTIIAPTDASVDGSSDQ